MGLDISHNTFSGSYSAFNRFRQAICKAIGGSFPPHEDKTLNPFLWYWPNLKQYSSQSHPGLTVLLSHSDCNGSISPQTCLQLANELQTLLPELKQQGIGTGHIKRDGRYAAMAKKFIAGCHLAATQNEPIEFF